MLATEARGEAENPKTWAQVQIPLQVVGARGLPDLPKAPFPEWKTGEMRTALTPPDIYKE